MNPPAPSRLPGAPTTILVVEDDQPVLQMATHILRAAGHRVVSARSAEEALALEGAQGGLDLLFTDVVLPGMDGLGLVEAMARRRSMAVLVTTGQRTAEVQAAISKAGTAYLPKPYTATALRQAVERALGSAPVAAVEP